MQNRREFLRKSTLVSAVSLLPLGPSLALDRAFGAIPRILPKRLKPGDRIGLVTPGSPVSKDQLEGTVNKLKSLGLEPVYKETVLSEYGYFAGPDQERAEELMQMFTDTKVDAIWCVRGGYGSIRILDLLDFDIIRENPKLFIGYSDITAILTAIYQETGLVTFHGPVGISNFDRFTVRSLRKVIMEPEDSYKYPYKRGKGSRGNPEYDRYTINPGIAEGLLIGGNISVLDSMIGTRFEPDFEGKIVYLEEIEEKTYRVDKMLFHLLSGTNLKKAAGLALGVFADCNVGDEPTLSLDVAIRDLLSNLEIPVVYGLAFGHIDSMITLPNGIRARLDAEKNQLEILEQAVK